MTHHHHHKHHRRYTFQNFLQDIKPVTKEAGHIFDEGTKVANTGLKEVGATSRSFINKSGNLLDKISMPLIIVGGVIAFIVITKK
jgi:hypothetical protein